MSRRSHHPARRHVRPHAEPRPPRPAGPSVVPAGSPFVELAAQAAPAQVVASDAPASERPASPMAVMAEPLSIASPVVEAVPVEPALIEPVQAEPEVVATMPAGPRASDVPVAAPGGLSRPGPAPAPANAARPPTPSAAQNGPGDAERNACTAPQLRRFIKSRAYVPMHELRRRFGIEGQDDDVTGVEMGSGTHVYVGLPQREGLLLGELLRARDVGYELSLDPISPIVVGVFPMRPIPRS